MGDRIVVSFYSDRGAPGYRPFFPKGFVLGAVPLVQTGNSGPLVPQTPSSGHLGHQPLVSCSYSLRFLTGSLQAAIPQPTFREPPGPYAALSLPGALGLSQPFVLPQEAPWRRSALALP